MLTKHMYQKIAKIVRTETFTQVNDGFKYVIKEHLVDALCIAFKEDNERFDAEIFRGECM